MMSDHYRRKVNAHRRRERRGRIHLAAGLAGFLIAFVVFVRCAASLAMTGSLI